MTPARASMPRTTGRGWSRSRDASRLVLSIARNEFDRRHPSSEVILGRGIPGREKGGFSGIFRGYRRPRRSQAVHRAGPRGMGAAKALADAACFSADRSDARAGARSPVDKLDFCREGALFALPFPARGDGRAHPRGDRPRPAAFWASRAARPAPSQWRAKK